MKRKLKEHLEVILTIHAVATEDGTCDKQLKGGKHQELSLF